MRCITASGSKCALGKWYCPRIVLVICTGGAVVDSTRLKTEAKGGEGGCCQYKEIFTYMLGKYYVLCR